ncbi:hypothetical protein [Dictyobacter kobayashii]|uniref:Chemotaxis methyl-accepting receptor HlyB-like 4HB MCP domain-containing protein n=1 Tax=Dictyobacter kobayashii TaxID=2014872 RepID=A0A402AVH3_9CHLR|nr:hypothetical protein [Dictyobacter kobayashii]GCE23075.1 hypothetical protein KDK_68750 [Dictyobacter kobayashii]
MNAQQTNAITTLSRVSLNKWLILIGLFIGVLVCLVLLGVHFASHLQLTSHTLHLLADGGNDVTGPIGGGN